MPDDFCRLGDVKFSSNITGFQSDEGFDYAKIDLAKGKPHLQPMGESLSKVNIEIKLRSYLGANVASMIDAIRNMKSSGEPHILVFASGTYGGSYVIENISSMITKTDKHGNITQADLQLQLLEYAEQHTASGRRTETGRDRTTNRKVTEETE